MKQGRPRLASVGEQLVFELPYGRGWLARVHVAAMAGAPAPVGIEIVSALEDHAPLGALRATDLHGFPLGETWEAVLRELRQLLANEPLSLWFAGITSVPVAGNQRAGRPQLTDEELTIRLAHTLESRKPDSGALRTSYVVRRARKAGIGSAEGLSPRGHEILKRIRDAQKAILEALPPAEPLPASDLVPLMTLGYSYAEINAAVADLEAKKIVQVTHCKGSRGLNFTHLTLSQAPTEDLSG